MNDKQVENHVPIYYIIIKILLFLYKIYLYFEIQCASSIATKDINFWSFKLDSIRLKSFNTNRSGDTYNIFSIKGF